METVHGASTPFQPSAPTEAEGPGTRPDPSDLPPSGVDAMGRALPVSDEDWTARQVWLTNQLAAIDDSDDTPIEVYDQILRSIDEERLRAGRPPAFGRTS